MLAVASCYFFDVCSAIYFVGSIFVIQLHQARLSPICPTFTLAVLSVPFNRGPKNAEEDGREEIGHLADLLNYKTAYKTN